MSPNSLRALRGKGLCLLHLRSPSPLLNPQVAHRGVCDDNNECQAKITSPIAPLISVGTGKWPGLCIKHLLELFPQPPTPPQGTQAPASQEETAHSQNLCTWSHHHLLEILLHDTQVAVNSTHPNPPTPNCVRWGFSLGSPWGMEEGHQATEIGVSPTSSKLYCTLLVDRSS